MEKVKLTVPWGQYNPIVKKKQNKNSVYYNVFFSPNNISQQVCTEITTDKHNFVLGNFEYKEPNIKKYRKCITKRKQYTRSKKKKRF
jgi:hypothetical protein